MDDPVRDALADVYWIGGGSGAGKSTIARRLAAACGLTPYSTDASMGAHAERTPSAQRPLLTAFLAMDQNERWVHRSPETMLETFHWFHGEAFDPIVSDLVDLGRTPVVAEGFRLLPHRVKPLLTSARRAVWLLPTPRFRRRAFATRGSSWTIAGTTDDPPRALRNLLDRDRLFTERLRVEVVALDLPFVDVDVTTSEEALLGRVRAGFGL